MQETLDLFFPVLSFWFGVIFGTVIWTWRNIKHTFKWQVPCWFRKHKWVEVEILKESHPNLFDCQRCGLRSRKDAKGRYVR